jgi:hypothetical protein
MSYDPSILLDSDIKKIIEGKMIKTAMIIEDSWIEDIEILYEELGMEYRPNSTSYKDMKEIIKEETADMIDFVLRLREAK